MKRFLLVLALPLVLASPAAAKELTSATVCGPSRCTTIESRRDATTLAHVGDTVGHAAAPGPYYVVTLKGEAEGEEFGWKAFYVPGDELWASFDDSVGLVNWSGTTSTAAPLLERATDGLEPFPAPTIEAVRVDGSQVAGEPQSYLRLFAAQSADGRAAEPRTYDWVPVDLVAAGATPWTLSDRDLMFSPSTGTIERVGARIALDDDTAGALAAGETLPSPGGSLPWTAVGIGLALVAAALLLLLLLRRPQPAPESRPSPA